MYDYSYDCPSMYVTDYETLVEMEAEEREHYSTLLFEEELCEEN